MCDRCGLGTGTWSSGFISFPVLENPSLEREYEVKNTGFARISLPLPATVVCQSCGFENRVNKGHVYFVCYSYSLWWNKESLFKCFFTNVVGVETPHIVCQNHEYCRESLLLVEEDGKLFGYPISDNKGSLKLESLLRLRLEEKYGNDPHKWSKEVLYALNPYR